MNIKILVFAHLKEVLGFEEVQWEVSEGISSKDLFDQLESKYPVVKDHRKHLKMAMNGEYIQSNDRIVDNAEIAIFPPVSGG